MASRRAAELYGLEILEEGIQVSDGYLGGSGLVDAAGASQMLSRTYALHGLGAAGRERQLRLSTEASYTCLSPSLISCSPKLLSLHASRT